MSDPPPCIACAVGLGSVDAESHRERTHGRDQGHARGGPVGNGSAGEEPFVVFFFYFCFFFVLFFLFVGFFLFFSFVFVFGVSE